MERIQIPRFEQFKPSSESASRAKRKNRSRDTIPEVLLRQAIWRCGLRYRKNATDLPGKPDIVFRRAGVVVFCDGDFWHGRDWDHLQEKLNRSANRAYWLPKIARNRQRDAEQTEQLRTQGWHVEKFFGWLDKQTRSFAAVSLEDVDAFLSDEGKQGWCRVSVATSAKALCAFCLYAAVRGWCAASIASGIDGPRLFQHEGLPVGPSWSDVQRLIASSGGDSARDIRDRAILILLATYGFRSSEVAGLRLEDVNWERETVSIVRPKQRRAQEYPLVSEAAEAILLYLQRVRPTCTRREVFCELSASLRIGR